MSNSILNLRWSISGVVNGTAFTFPPSGVPRNTRVDLIAPYQTFLNYRCIPVPTATLTKIFWAGGTPEALGDTGVVQYLVIKPESNGNLAWSGGVPPYDEAQSCAAVLRAGCPFVVSGAAFTGPRNAAVSGLSDVEGRVAEGYDASGTGLQVFYFYQTTGGTKKVHIWNIGNNGH